MIQLRTMVPLLGAVLLSATGQLFLKAGAQRLGDYAGTHFLMAAARTPAVLLGLIAWCASTACWLLVLRDAPLSRAYGLTSLTFVIIPLAGVVIFGEQFRRVHAVGTLLIIAGVVCMLAGD
ncbi:MAG TPA: EamA family transporter [Longimicrobiales bacterium]